MTAEQRELLRRDLEAMRARYPGYYVGIVDADWETANSALLERPEEDPSWGGFEKPTLEQLADIQRAIDLGDELDGLRLKRP